MNNQTLAAFGDPSLSYAYYAGTLTDIQVASATPLDVPPKDVGDYTVVASFTSNLPGYLNATSAPTYFSITPASLTISATTDSKVYDGTTTTNAVPTVSGLLGTDTVTGLSESYSSKDVLGTGRSTLQVNSGYTVNDGNGGNDYTVTLDTALGTITAATLTLTALTKSKVYDGTASANPIPTASGLIGSDTVTGLSESFVSKDVLGAGGSTLQVNAGYIVHDGNNGGDYTAVLQTATGTITPATLTVTTVTNTKVYDGTTMATVAPTIAGLLGSDTIIGLTESFISKNVLGSSKSTLHLSSSYTINDGNNGNDYTVNITSKAATGTITLATLTISAGSGTKVYDSTTVSSTKPLLVGIAGTDTVTATEFYATKDVLGSGNSTLVLRSGYTVNDGNSGKNYTVTIGAMTATATITPAPLTITAASRSKVYDATTSSSGIPAARGLKGTDSVTGLSESYTSKDVVGSGKSTLQVNTGFSVNDGNSGNNYSVTVIAIGASITATPLTISAETNAKVYDGTTSASATPTVTGLLGSDTVTGETESYSFKNVLGTDGSTLHVNAGYTVNDGDGGQDYKVTKLTATGTIAPAALTISATTNSKVYDGTSTASAVPTASGLVATDTVKATESYLSKDVLGTDNSTLQVNAVYTIHDGNHGNNYTVMLSTATGTITPAVLTITAASKSKVYDGTTSSSGLPTASGLKKADTVTGLSEAYAVKDVLGSGLSTLQANAGYTINDGNDGNDYSVILKTAIGTITPAALTLTATTNTKVYDATTSASAIPAVAGLFGSESVTGLTESYASKNVVGAGRSTLQVDAGYSVQDGNGGLDYKVVFKTTTGTITPESLTISAATNEKTYDGTISAAAALTVSGLLGTDTVTGLLETYASKDAKGIGGSTLMVSAYTINDGVKGNDYTVTKVTASGTIDKADAVIVVTPYTIKHDGKSHTATGLGKGVLGEKLSGLSLSGTTHTNVGTYSDTWTFTDSTGNYNNASDMITDSITP